MNNGILDPEILAGTIKNLLFLATILAEFDSVIECPHAFRTRKGREHLISLRTLFCKLIGGLSQLHTLSYNHHPWHGLIHGYIKRTAFTISVIQSKLDEVQHD